MFGEDEEQDLEQYPLCFLSLEGEAIKVGVNSNDWTAEQFFVPFVPMANIEGADIGAWSGWKLLTLVAQPNASTLFVDGKKFGVAGKTASAPIIAFGGHPYIQKGETEMDVEAFSSLWIWQARALSVAEVAEHAQEALAHPPRALDRAVEQKHVASSDGKQLVVDPASSSRHSGAGPMLPPTLPPTRRPPRERSLTGQLPAPPAAIVRGVAPRPGAPAGLNAPFLFSAFVTCTWMMN